MKNQPPHLRIDMDYTLKPFGKPSVTELLDILAKPALISWANKIGLEGKSLADARKKSMGDGYSLHKQIERFIQSKTPFEDLEFQNRFEAFFADKSILAFEKSVSCDEYQGRFDIKFLWNDIEYICDFKSNQTGLYIENKLQLAAYRKCEGCAKVAIISIPSMALIEVPILNFTPYEQCLSALAKIHHLKKYL